MKVRSMLMFSVVAISAAFNQSAAQITKTQIADEKINLKTVPYDSLHNFLGENYAAYKGQELYVMPQAEVLRKYGYEGFTTTAEKKNIYKPNPDGYNSEYNALAEKYFVVLDVIERKELYGSAAYFKLQEKGGKTVIYFTYNDRFEHAFPFLTVGYFEKQKSMFVGNDVLIRHFPKLAGSLGKSQKKTVDINTGEEIVERTGAYEKCVDITVETKYYQLVLIVQNEEGKKYSFDLKYRHLDVQRIFTKQEAEAYKTKFGEEIWSDILAEKVKIGFTKQMCLLGWGKPKKVNRTVLKDKISEQWVYDGGYLYFDNGILTAKQ